MLTLEETNGRVSHRPKQILIVEDEVLIREAIAHSLQRESYEVLVAASAEVVLDLLLPSDYPNRWLIADLLVLDSTLPGMSGMELCKFIRDKNNNIPILMLSSVASQADCIMSLELGADDFLSKPFGIAELVARCRALLRRLEYPPVAMSSTLKVGNITLNLQTSTVSVRGEEKFLSRKEFHLLKFLMQHPQKAWTREQLMTEIWGRNFSGDRNILTIHIRHLREKLEVDPMHPEYILTVRRLGYRLALER